MNPRLLRTLIEQRIYVLAAFAVVVILVTTPEFRSIDISQNVLQRASTVGLMAVGMTVVILAGQLDLSVGSTMALAGVLAIDLQGELGNWGAILVALLAGASVGVVNGTLVTKANINPIIVTLATMIGVRGVALTLTESRPARPDDPFFGPGVDQALIGPITPRIAIFLGVVLLGHLALSYWRPGRNMYAIGGNPEAARLAGISRTRYILGGFIFSGVTSATAGILLALSLNTGSPIVGAQSVITVVAAVVIAGTSLLGGTANMLKTLMGVLLLTSVETALNLNGFEVQIQAIVTGTILIIVIIIDARLSANRDRLAAVFNELIERSSRESREQRAPSGVLTD